MSGEHKKLDSLSIASTENTIMKKMSCNDVIDLSVLLKNQAIRE